MKERNPYSFILSNKAFEVIKNFVLDYYSTTMHSELENKLDKLRPPDYTFTIVADSWIDTFEYSELNILIEKHLYSLL